jgi:hypothetical protein
MSKFVETTAANIVMLATTRARRSLLMSSS